MVDRCKIGFRCILGANTLWVQRPNEDEQRWPYITLIALTGPKQVGWASHITHPPNPQHKRTHTPVPQHPFGIHLNGGVSKMGSSSIWIVSGLPCRGDWTGCVSEHHRVLVSSNTDCTWWSVDYMAHTYWLREKGGLTVAQIYFIQWHYGWCSI